MATPITDNIVALGYDVSGGSSTLFVYKEDLSSLFSTNTSRSGRIAIDAVQNLYALDNQSAGSIKRFDTTGSLVSSTSYTTAYTPLDMEFNYEQDLIVSESVNGTNNSYIAFLERDFSLLSRTLVNGQKPKRIDVTNAPGGKSRLFTSGDSYYNQDTANWGAVRLYSMENNIPTLEYVITTWDDPTPSSSVDSTFWVAATEDGSRYAYHETLSAASAKPRIVVRDGNDHSILAVFTTDGAYTDWDGNAATGISLGDTPRSVAFDRDGNIIIDCQYATKKYDTSYNIVYSEIKAYQSSFNGAPIDVDSSGNAWVYDQTEVSVYNPTGTRSTINNSNRGVYDITARKPWWGEAPAGSITEVCRTQVPLTQSTPGGAVISTAQKKFGSSSIYGNNTGWLETGTNVVPSTGEFTIELWFYNTALPTYSTFASNFNSTIDNGSFHISTSNVGLDVFFKSTVIGNYGYTSGSAATPINQWHHVAIQRDSGNNLSIYLNGTRVKHTAWSQALHTGQFYVGGREFGYLAPEYLRAYIDEFRVSSIARYSGTSIAVPTAAFEADADTLLLIHGEGTIVDDNCYDVIGAPGNAEFLSLYSGSAASTSPLTFAKQLYRTFSAAVTSAASLVRESSLSKFVSATVTASPVLSRSVGYVRNVSSNVSAAASTVIQRGYKRALAAGVSVGSSLSALKAAVLTLAATVTSTASVSSLVYRLYEVALSAGVAMTSSISKVASYFRSLSANVISTSALNTYSVIIRLLSAGVTASGSIAKSVGKAVQDVMSVAGSTSRGLEDIILQAGVAVIASIQKSVTKAVDVGITGTSSIQKAVTKVFDSVVNVAESVQKGTAKAIGAVSMATTAVSKNMSKALSATVTGAANILKRVNAGLSLAVNVAVNGTIGKSVTKAVSSTVSNTINITKYIAKAFTDVVVSTEVVTRPIIKIYETLMTLSAISYLRERVEDILRKTTETSTDTTHPTETNTFRKEDDA